jgi:acetyl esterase/lipase
MDFPQRLSLWAGNAPFAKTAEEDAFISIYQPDEPAGTAMVICPGGGYEMLCLEPEGHGIARWLAGEGITGIVLEYRLPQQRPLVPLLDAQRALRTLRSRASEFGILPDRLGIIGFSAGGHLASAAATRFDEGRPDAADPIERADSRPDFALLIYPVITMGEGAHEGSRMALIGSDLELADGFSSEEHVTPRTPPCFLAHAADDSLVSPENSRVFYQALKAAGVPAEYLELPDGGHGLNGYQGKSWDAWRQRGLQWLKEMEKRRI